MQPLSVYVWEALTAGVCGESLPASLLQEGRAMWQALVADLLRIDGGRVFSIWHTSAGDPPIEQSDRLQIALVEESRTAGESFDRLAAECDHSWIIAPELDGLLVDRLQRVKKVGGRIVGPNISATQLCSDKLRLARHLAEHGITTPATSDFSAENIPAFPAVIKRRDGAGSCDCRLIRTRDDWEQFTSERQCSDEKPPLIVQPFVVGLAVSVVAIVSNDRQHIEVFPPGRQLLSDDGTFAYRGGEIPWATGCDNAIRDLVRQTVAVIPGLTGYVGFDLQLPDDGTGPVLIEINPRLTTAYVGYRELTAENLAARVIAPHNFPQPIVWMPGSVRFSPDGRRRDE